MTVDINFDMQRRRHWIPSTSALLAFECAARHCNFSRAAAELNTSQSAISRHIAALESLLSVRLFERKHRRLELTAAGDHFYHAIVSGLDNIQSSAMALAKGGDEDELVITCTHEISHLFVMPRFDGLQQAIGAEVAVRIMTSDYDTVEVLSAPRADVMFTYDVSGVPAADRTVAFWESVIPVCSPGYAKANAEVLSQPVSAWGALTFLNLTKRNRGWATWEDWYAMTGTPDESPKFIDVENYVYLLEAAAAGRGIALGWLRVVDRYLESGALVRVADEPVEFDRAAHLVLTEHGRGREPARRCLEFFRGNA